MAPPFGAPTVQTRQDYVSAWGANLTTLLNVTYGLLAVAIIIALLGIGNTLSLSIHQRTHELGLLRAVGATRRQLRSMVRWESLIVALFGTLGGVLLGLFIVWGVSEAIAKSGTSQFTIPAVPLVIIVVIGALVGVLAALRPANRAANLDILQAVAYE